MNVRIFGNIPTKAYERRFVYWLIEKLEKTSNQYYVFTSITLGGGEIDIIIINPAGIFLIELKKVIGKLKVSLNGEWLACSENTTKVLNENRKNPYQQVTEKYHELKNYFNKNKQQLLGDIQSRLPNIYSYIVIISEKDIHIEGEEKHKYIRVVHPEELLKEMILEKDFTQVIDVKFIDNLVEALRVKEIKDFDIFKKKNIYTKFDVGANIYLTNKQSTPYVYSVLKDCKNNKLIPVKTFIENICSFEDLIIIEGKPGVGKSRLLNELIYYYCKKYNKCSKDTIALIGDLTFYKPEGLLDTISETFLKFSIKENISYEELETLIEQDEVNKIICLDSIEYITDKKFLHYLKKEISYYMNYYPKLKFILSIREGHFYKEVFKEFTFFQLQEWNENESAEYFKSRGLSTIDIKNIEKNIDISLLKLPFFVELITDFFVAKKINKINDEYTLLTEVANQIFSQSDARITTKENIRKFFSLCGYFMVTKFKTYLTELEFLKQLEEFGITLNNKIEELINTNRIFTKVGKHYRFTHDKWEAYWCSEYLRINPDYNIVKEPYFNYVSFLWLRGVSDDFDLANKIIDIAFEYNNTDLISYGLTETFPGNVKYKLREKIKNLIFSKEDEKRKLAIEIIISLLQKELSLWGIKILLDFYQQEELNKMTEIFLNYGMIYWEYFVPKDKFYIIECVDKIENLFKLESLSEREDILNFIISQLNNFHTHSLFVKYLLFSWIEEIKVIKILVEYIGVSELIKIIENNIELYSYNRFQYPIVDVLRNIFFHTNCSNEEKTKIISILEKMVEIQNGIISPALELLDDIGMIKPTQREKNKIEQEIYYQFLEAIKAENAIRLCGILSKIFEPTFPEYIGEPSLEAYKKLNIYEKRKIFQIIFKHISVKSKEINKYKKLYGLCETIEERIKIEEKCPELFGFIGIDDILLLYGKFLEENKIQLTNDETENLLGFLSCEQDFSLSGYKQCFMSILLLSKFYPKVIKEKIIKLFSEVSFRHSLVLLRCLVIYCSVLDLEVKRDEVAPNIIRKISECDIKDFIIIVGENINNPFGKLEWQGLISSLKFLSLEDKKKIESVSDKVDKLILGIFSEEFLHEKCINYIQYIVNGYSKTKLTGLEPFVNLFEKVGKFEDINRIQKLASYLEDKRHKDLIYKLMNVLKSKNYEK